MPRGDRQFRRAQARRGTRPLVGAAMCCCLIGVAMPSDRLLAPSVPTTIDQRESSNLTAAPDTTGPPAAPSIDALIEQYSAHYGLRVALVRAVVQAESSFDPRAVSSKGAKGLMQLMPLTASAFGVTDPFDPAENLRAGTAYLRHLLDRYHGDERRALAAYAGGPDAGDRLGARPSSAAAGSDSSRAVATAQTLTVAAVEVSNEAVSPVERPMTPESVVH